MSETADVAELLQHASWMRRLAMSLVRNDAAADDLVQETWVVALRHPPRTGETVRAWLGEVLRNVLRAKFRGESRRARREDATASSIDERTHVPTPEQLVGTVEMQRLLAGEVTSLDEPYRSTLLLRFYEGLSPTEIAARQGLPAGTVRWRLKEGLDQLRSRLDRRHAGNRGAWLRALAPLTGDRLASLAKQTSASALKGALAVKIGAATVIAAVVVVAVLSFKQRTIAQRPPNAAGSQPQSAAASAARGQPRPGLDSQARADLLKRIEAARRAAHPAEAAHPFGVTTAHTGSAAPPPAEEHPLDAEYIREQIKELLPLIKECFESALETTPGLSGRIVVGFSIVGDPSVGGLVGESKVIDGKSTIADKELRECIQESMYAAKFPPPKEGGEVEVEYPFVLKPAEDSPDDNDEHAHNER